MLTDENGKKLIIACFVCIFTATCGFAQTAETTYYTDPALTVKAQKRNANYTRNVTIAADGIKAIEVLRNKDNVVVRKEFHKGKEPVGKWIYTAPAYGSQPKALDYDFELVYDKKNGNDIDTANLLHKNFNIKAVFINDSTKAYIAPKFMTGDRSLNSFVQRRIAYPVEALDNNLTGRVNIGFRVDTNGLVKDIKVITGVNPLLDKEAMRIIRELKFRNGATLDGKPKFLQLAQPIIFELGY